MGNNKNKITDVTVGLAIIIGISINGFLANQKNVPVIASFIITFLISSTIHAFMFWVLKKFINHSDFLLKLFWGKMYIKGFWSYTYMINNEKKYGIWCIDQDIDTITIKGFGITQDGVRRSDVQSLTSLIVRGNDYEVVNMRKDISTEGVMSDTFYYSKTTLHLQQRNTVLNLFNYPLKMDGVTYIYGSYLSGNIHQRLVFTKHRDAKDEHDIEEIVKNMIHIIHLKENTEYLNKKLDRTFERNKENIRKSEPL
jgi:hypothetical protein